MTDDIPSLLRFFLNGEIATINSSLAREIVGLSEILFSQIAITS